MEAPEREEERYIYNFLEKITGCFYAEWYLCQRK